MSMEDERTPIDGLAEPVPHEERILRHAATEKKTRDTNLKHGRLAPAGDV